VRALLTAMIDWVVVGKKPPPSNVPRLRDGVLMAPSSQASVGFPTIPGVNYNGAANERELFDYGPEFGRGIISRVPPSRPAALT
jgi:hypothetical protein